LQRLTSKHCVSVFAAVLCFALGARPAPAAGQSVAARVLVDEVGRTVTVRGDIRRIVSLAPNLTETVYALGAQERLFGVTDYCDYPAEARSKARVGSPVNPSLEAIVALRPDVVLATRSINRLATVDALERAGIAVYATDAKTVDGVLTSIGHLAGLLGTPQQGNALLADLRARLDALQKRLDGLVRRRALFVVWESPLITIGPETFLADALRRAGAESVVHTSQDWPQLSMEEVVRLQPDYLIFTADHTESSARDFSGLRKLAGWSELAAVKGGHLAVVSDAIDRPAPRLIDAIESLAHQMHPEAFTEKTLSAPQPKPIESPRGLTHHGARADRLGGGAWSQKECSACNR
jgi:iron complex transport system substrate-binding protein